ncbi:MAG: aspartate/glutamate racemase family protein [Candidatus Puniceispirillaceae bacterium]|jgi:aspartate racemase|nr:aspartate/glutamate racemase family protein [Pseudomonadota bacterium]
MKIIGLIGGMSWESTKIYYEYLNEAARDRLGGLHSARIIMVSVDFAPIESLLKQRDWDGIAPYLVTAARQLEAAGAECVLLCTNTMHKLAPQITEHISIPFFHIIDVLGMALQENGHKQVGLLGTMATMQNEEIADMLASRYGVSVIVPDARDMDIVNQIIFDELCLGQVHSASRNTYLEIMNSLNARGAEAIILGCTEIAMLVSSKDTAIPLYDTTALHASYATDWSLS